MIKQYSSAGDRIVHLVLTANPKRPETEKARARIAEIAAAMGFSYTLYNGEETDVPPNTDAFVVIGGDGSLIRVAHVTCKRGLPLIGVHCGRVGFLTELNESEIEMALSRLRAGDYAVSTRVMLDVRVNNGEPVPCLNDVLVFKHSFSGVTQLDFSVDANPVGTLFGDGVVVATPTGATGYSLSAGGPIVADGLDAMLITPICPHTLHIRPIVASINSTITIRLSEACFVAADGDRIAELKKGDLVTVTRSSYVTKILTFGDRNPFRLISEKLS